MELCLPGKLLLLQFGCPLRRRDQLAPVLLDDEHHVGLSNVAVFRGLVAGTDNPQFVLAGTGCLVDMSLPCPRLGCRPPEVARGPQSVVLLLVVWSIVRRVVVPGTPI